MTREQEFKQLAEDQMIKVTLAALSNEASKSMAAMTSVAFMTGYIRAAMVHDCTGQSNLAFLESVESIFKKAELPDVLNPFKCLPLLEIALEEERNQ